MTTQKKERKKGCNLKNIPDLRICSVSSLSISFIGGSLIFEDQSNWNWWDTSKFCDSFPGPLDQLNISGNFQPRTLRTHHTFTDSVTPPVTDLWDPWSQEFLQTCWCQPQCERRQKSCCAPSPPAASLWCPAPVVYQTSQAAHTFLCCHIQTILLRSWLPLLLLLTLEIKLLPCWWLQLLVLIT